LTERAGRAHAAWLAMFGEALTRSEAAALGIVTRVVPVDNARRRYDRGDTAPLIGLIPDT
jgi:enoyl-CoA hydratase/carnithine racemase